MAVRVRVPLRAHNRLCGEESSLTKLSSPHFYWAWLRQASVPKKTPLNLILPWPRRCELLAQQFKVSAREIKELSQLFLPKAPLSAKPALRFSF